jgi:hypothetical protein
MKYKIIVIIEILLLMLKFSFEVKAGSNEENFKLKNAGLIYVEIFYSDSAVYRIPIENNISPLNKSDLYTNIQLISKNIDREKEVEITLKRLKSKKIKFVDFIVNFNSQFGDSNLIYFNNSFFTNAWANVIKPDSKGTPSRELVLFRNSKHNNNLNIGFTTFNRFFTYFQTYNNRVIVRQCMEDRALRGL